MIVSILIFLVIFGILVISHEGGHFLIAKANGIRVAEFTVGMGPALFKTKKGDTEYSVRLLPFGGACIFDGMDGLEEAKEEETEEYDEHAYKNAKVWSRIATVFAGPLFNFILAYLLAVIVTAFSSWTFPVISGMTEDSAAAEAGLMTGDTIVSINGEKIYMGQEVTLISQLNAGEALEIVYERDGQQYTTIVTPKYDEEAQRYYMGLYVGEYGDIKGIDIIPYSWHTVTYYFKMTWKSLAMLVTGHFTINDLSGPVGIVKVVDDTYEAVKPYGLPSLVLTMLDLAILLSVNLGVMNLLPLPALDGGKLIFLFIEVLRGKPVPPEKEGYVHLAGMIALMILMVVVLFNDIGRFLH
ncbi:MAG: RIP metalloprotease RseP [Butyrivibrio sp.]|nr:RIP metalloprotease RseP [Butyrivibrio sp.]